MATPTMPQLQEVAIVLCMDSTMNTIGFWHKSAFAMYLLPLLKSLGTAYTGQPASVRFVPIRLSWCRFLTGAPEADPFGLGCVHSRQHQPSNPHKQLLYERSTST